MVLLFDKLKQSTKSETAMPLLLLLLTRRWARLEMVKEWWSFGSVCKCDKEVWRVGELWGLKACGGALLC